MPLYSRSASTSTYEAGPPSEPLASEFTGWANQGTSTATDGVRNLIITPQADGAYRSLIKASPGATFNVYMRAKTLWDTTSAASTIQAYFGIVVRNSAQSRLVFFGMGEQNSSATQSNFARRVNLTTDGAANTPGTPKTMPRPIEWLRVECDGTNLSGYSSVDGVDWLLFETVTIASFLTAAGGSLDGIGIGAIGTSTAGAKIYVSYFSTNPPA